MSNVQAFNNLSDRQSIKPNATACTAEDQRVTDTRQPAMGHSRSQLNVVLRTLFGSRRRSAQVEFNCLSSHILRDIGVLDFDSGERGLAEDNTALDDSRGKLLGMRR